MSDNAVFNAAYHPELLHVPLKGKWLQEFTATLQDVIEPVNQASSGNPQLQRLMGSVMSEVSTKITANLSGEAAGKYGIDANDLRSLLSHKLNIDHAADLDLLMATEASIMSASNKQEARSQYKEYILQACDHLVMNAFCAALAYQEQQVPALEKGVRDFMQHAERLAVQSITVQKMDHPDTFATHAARQMQAMGSAVGILTSAATVARMEERRSPLATMQRETLEGSRLGPSAMDIFRQELAVIYDLDPAKAADQQRLRMLGQQALQQASDFSKLPMPVLKELY